jgi:hypothetical protein
MQPIIGLSFFETFANADLLEKKYGTAAAAAPAVDVFKKSRRVDSLCFIVVSFEVWCWRPMRRPADEGAMAFLRTSDDEPPVAAGEA